VAGSADALDGDELAGGAAARLGDGAVAARAEGARLLVILRVADGHALPVADRHRSSWNLGGVEAWEILAEEGGEKLRNGIAAEIAGRTYSLWEARL
jgi:hypothetical protein